VVYPAKRGGAHELRSLDVDQDRKACRNATAGPRPPARPPLERLARRTRRGGLIPLRGWRAGASQQSSPRLRPKQSAEGGRLRPPSRPRGWAHPPAAAPA
jgi:hypothetical protein